MPILTKCDVKNILSAFPPQYSPVELTSSSSSEVYCAWVDRLCGKRGRGRKKMLLYLRLNLKASSEYQEWIKT